MKFKKLKLLIPIIISPILLTNLVSCSFIGTHYEVIKKNSYNYEIKDYFSKDAQSVANDNNVLVYSIDWIATIHKYAPIAHILKVLEINPNQEIYLYINNHVLSKEKIDTSSMMKYKNLHIEFYDMDKNNLWSSFNFKAIDLFFQKYTDNGKSLKLYCDDYQIFKVINENLTKNKYKNFEKTYKKLMLFDSITLLSDGVASSKFWDNEYYELFQNPTYQFNTETNNFLEAIQFLEKLKNMPDNEFEDWITRNNNSNIFILCLLLSYNNEKFDLPSVQYFVPSTLMIEDINNPSSPILTFNDKYNEFFDPYNSKNLDFINFFNSLGETQKKDFLTFFKSNDPNYVETQLENSFNVVYTGRRLDSNEIIKQEADRLIKLYEMYKGNQNLKIWFKGHPREKYDLKVTLSNEISKRGYKNVQDWLYILDNTIPMEFYIALNIFENNDSLNKKVIMYTTNSTYVLFLHCANKIELIEKIILSKDELSQINYIFGDLKESKCFPQNKIIKDTDF